MRQSIRNADLQVSKLVVLVFFDASRRPDPACKSLDVKFMNKKKKGIEAANMADAKSGSADKKGSSWNSKGKAEPAKGKKK
jgi:hypothetical protein